MDLRFNLFVFLILILARFDPSIGSKGGVLRPEITNNFAVAFICFSGALTQPLKGAIRAFQHPHLVLFLQGFMFIIFPCIAYGLSFILLLTPIHEPLIDGLLLVSTLPPAVSSCIQMTKLVHGNVALATLNSIIGCAIGLLITASRTALTNGPLEAFGQISELLKIILIIVIIPLLIGQVIQHYFYRSLQQYNGYVNTFAEIMILFLFYTALCGTFTRTDSDDDLDTFSLVIITSTMCLLYVWTNILLFVSSYFVLHYDRADVAAILFVGSRKSLVLGLPIIETVLKDYPEIGCLSLPLLIYKPVQIILGGLSVEPLRLWVTSRQRRRSRK